jgi:hypothetical protein
MRGGDRRSPRPIQTEAVGRTASLDAEGEGGGLRPPRPLRSTASRSSDPREGPTSERAFPWESLPPLGRSGDFTRRDVVTCSRSGLSKPQGWLADRVIGDHCLLVSGCLADGSCTADRHSCGGLLRGRCESRSRRPLATEWFSTASVRPETEEGMTVLGATHATPRRESRPSPDHDSDASAARGTQSEAPRSFPRSPVHSRAVPRSPVQSRAIPRNPVQSRAIPFTPVQSRSLPQQRVPLPAVARQPGSR